ncbi:MAG: pentapeptide repeat-containing protein [Pseudonocardiaceae bacterium]
MGAIILVSIDAAILILLTRRYIGEGHDVELNAIRTAGALVVVTGGAFALLLAALRHRYTGLTLSHTERDATERRITELYTRAADQLGSSQAPVRLAGLYALERLANSTAEHQQTIVNVICVYLRMPYTLPPEHSDARSNAYRSQGPRRRRRRALNDQPVASLPVAPRHQQAREERQVRLTAQEILCRNLTGPPVDRRRRWQLKRTSQAAPPWTGIRLDLTGAFLLDFTMTYCQLGNANFGGAQFIGKTSFAGTQFAGDIDFDAAQFSGDTDFSGARFIGMAYIVGARFIGNAHFGGAQFTRIATFANAQFAGVTGFSGAHFADGALFRGVRFSNNVSFAEAQFIGVIDFEHACVALNAQASWPAGWIVRSARADEDPGYRYLVQIDDMVTEET